MVARTKKGEVPKTVVFMGKTWTIEYKPMKDEFGNCDHQNLKITLMEGQQPDHLHDTVMHELVHAIDMEMGIKLREKQVTLLGTGLAHMLKNNPQLRRMFD